jgi:hypothetical protein
MEHSSNQNDIAVLGHHAALAAGWCTITIERFSTIRIHCIHGHSLSLIDL